MNNLAWIYLYEEEDRHRAKIILEEVIEQKPKSHFPYNMLGEISIKERQWIEAKGNINEITCPIPFNRSHS